MVCHIRPLSAREATDAAPGVLSTRQGTIPGQGTRAEALVQSGNAAYAFNHGAQTLPLLADIPPIHPVHNHEYFKLGLSHKLLTQR